LGIVSQKLVYSCTYFCRIWYLQRCNEKNTTFVTWICRWK